MWLNKFTSRRNDVSLILENGTKIVMKHFDDESCLIKEKQVYSLLRGTPVKASEIVSEDGMDIYLKYMEGITYSEMLDREEEIGEYNREAWLSLTDWLVDFCNYTGMAVTDTNLRNFLYDGKECIGLDFEQCEQGTHKDEILSLGAQILLQRPEKSELKQRLTDEILSHYAQRCSAGNEKLKTEMGLKVAELQRKRELRKINRQT